MTMNYYRPRRRLLENPEDILQAACFTLFAYKYPRINRLLFSIPNGGRRSMTTAKRMKATGQKRGTADAQLAMARGGVHGLFIEFKQPGRYPEPEQREFKKAVEQEGFAYVVCRTTEEFEALIDGYINLKGYARFIWK